MTEKRQPGGKGQNKKEALATDIKRWNTRVCRKREGEGETLPSIFSPSLFPFLSEPSFVPQGRGRGRCCLVEGEEEEDASPSLPVSRPLFPNGSVGGGGGGRREAKDKANPTFPPSQERRRDVAGGVVVVVVAPYAPSPPSARNI